MFILRVASSLFLLRSHFPLLVHLEGKRNSSSNNFLFLLLYQNMLFMFAYSVKKKKKIPNKKTLTPDQDQGIRSASNLMEITNINEFVVLQWKVKSQTEPAQTQTKTCYSSSYPANIQLLHLFSLRWLILKKRQGQKIEAPPLPLQNPHHHHHFHHYMKYDREHNPTMPCKCRRELASRRHKRYACIIWPGEHHLWGDSQRP